MIIAVDKGTTYTKSSRLISFKSTIREYQANEMSFSQDKIIVKYNNRIYTIGEDGKTNTNLFKSIHEETKLMMLVAIALASPNKQFIRTHLITGLPIGRYAYEKEQMNKLLQFTRNQLTVNDMNYTIDIGRVETFPEGASSFYSLSDVENGLIIDVGGLSVDTSLYEGNKKLTKYSTYRLGIMPMYRKIANHLSAKYSLTLNEWDIEGIIKNGLYIDGYKVDLDIDNIINSYIQEIIQALEFDYNVPSIKNIYLTGGGGILLYPYIKQIISRLVLMEDSQFTNVLSYQLLGEVLFNEED